MAVGVGTPALGDGDDVALVNAHIQEHHRGVLCCERTPDKGRILRATRAFEPGDVIFTEQALRIVRCEPEHPAFHRLEELCRSSDLDCIPLWYWCALKSLTSDDLGRDHATGVASDGAASDGWEPVSPEVQQRLLILHQGDVEVASEAVAAVAAAFAPGLKEAVKLERCLQAWLLNGFDVLGDDDDDGPAAPGAEQVQPGHATFFLPSFFSHSCFPSAIWHYSSDFSYVLRARRPIREGEEVTISYLDEDILLDHSRLRRNELSRRHFWCDCERCVNGDDLCRSMRCSRCRDGIVVAKLPCTSEGFSLTGAVVVAGVGAVFPDCLLRPLRPAIYDEGWAADLDKWLTIGAPILARKSGRFYDEVRLGSGVAEPQIGWATQHFEEHTNWIGAGIGDDVHGWGADGERGRLWHGGSFEATEWPRGGWREGDVIGCAVDLDSGLMTFSENGIWAPSARFIFSGEGRAFYPAMSLQGNFDLRLDAGAFEWSPPDPSYQPWLCEGRVCTPLDRRAPLRFAFAGATCGSCGAEVDALESARLTDCEQELGHLVDGWAKDEGEISPEGAKHAEQLMVREFARHSLAKRAREKLARLYGLKRKRDLQISCLREIRDFSTEVYPSAPTAAHAWAQSAHSDALAGAATVELRRARGFLEASTSAASAASAVAVPEPAPGGEDGGASAASMFEPVLGKLSLAKDDYEAALQTMSMMFGEEHAWAREVREKYTRSEKLLCEVRQQHAAVGGEGDV